MVKLEINIPAEQYYVEILEKSTFLKIYPLIYNILGRVYNTLEDENERQKI